MQIEDITISSLRGASDIHLQSCSTTNLILGRRKTTVLESIMLSIIGENIRDIADFSAVRGPAFELQQIPAMFPFADLYKGLEIYTTEHGTGKIRYLRIVPIKIDGFDFSGIWSTDENQHEVEFPKELLSTNTKRAITDYIPCVFIDSRHQHISSPQCLKKEAHGRIIQLLQIADPDIEYADLHLTLYSLASPPVIYLKHKKYGDIRSSYCGSRVANLLRLAFAVLEARNGILLLDDIESLIPFSCLKEALKWLLQTGKEYNTQIFVTTDSLEVISAIAEASVDANPDLVCYRIDQRDEMYSVKRFSEEMLNELVNSAGMDIR